MWEGFDKSKTELIEWFDTTEQLAEGCWHAKVVYENPLNNDLVVKLFNKDAESVFNGFCEALKDLHISFVSQLKGYDLWYFYKGIHATKARGN